MMRKTVPLEEEIERLDLVLDELEARRAPRPVWSSLRRSAEIKLDLLAFEQVISRDREFRD